MTSTKRVRLKNELRLLINQLEAKKLVFEDTKKLEERILQLKKKLYNE